MDKYKIAEGSSIAELEVEVNALMDAGYRPYGEVGHILGNFIQAMVYGAECADIHLAHSPRLNYHEENTDE